MELRIQDDGSNCRLLSFFANGLHFRSILAQDKARLDGWSGSQAEMRSFFTSGIGWDDGSNFMQLEIGAWGPIRREKNKDQEKSYSARNSWTSKKPGEQRQDNKRQQMRRRKEKSRKAGVGLWGFNDWWKRNASRRKRLNRSTSKLSVLGRRLV